MKNKVPLYAIIPCLNRHGMLSDLLNSIDFDPDYVVIVDTGSSPKLEVLFSGNAIILNEPLDSERNVQKWFNLALNKIDELALERSEKEYDVAVLNSDLIVEKQVLLQLQVALRFSDSIISHPDYSGELGAGEVSVNKTIGPVSARYRMTGCCFVLRGDSGIRFDEEFQWWFGDDDIEWRARVLGGVARVGKLEFIHLDPSGSMRDMPELNEKARQDQDLFISKWGSLPLC